MNYSMVQQASRRNGTAFRLDLPATGNVHYPRGGRRRKLTQEAVTTIRTWAAREGYGLSRKRQAKLLAPHFGVSMWAVLDVLDNESWRDLAYEPGTPDVAWLQTMTPTGVALVVLGGR